MKLFNFNKNKEVKKGKNYSFNVPFLSIPRMTDLSKPFLSKYRMNSGFEMHGLNNLYPNYCEQTYHLSPTHKACMNKIVNTAFSRYEIKGLSEIDTKVFELKNDLYNSIESIFMNYVVHDAFFIRVQKSTKNDTPKITVLDGGMIRLNPEKTVAYISEDWSTRRDIYTLKINEFGAEDFVYMYQHKSIGMGTYTLSPFNSILNDIEQEREITYLRSNAIKNSTYPSAVISLPYLIETEEEANELKETLTSQKGSDHVGDFFVLTGEGKENIPVVTQLNASSTGLDGLFEVNSDAIKNRILLAHSVPQQLLLSTPGKLGGSQEVKELYSIFVETVTSKITATVNQQLNFLFKEIGSKIEIEIFDLDYKAMFSDDDEVEVEDQDQDQDNNLQEVKKDNKNKKED